MSPEGIIKNHFDITQIFRGVDKEIQTVELIKQAELFPYNRLPLPRDIARLANISADDTRCCERHHDDNLRSIALTQESVAGVSSSAEDAINKRYKYCQQVIKPYIKILPHECRAFDENQEDHLKYYSDDFPDYQPCYNDPVRQLDLADKGFNLKSPTNSTNTPNFRVQKSLAELTDNSDNKQIDASSDYSAKGLFNDMEDTKSSQKIFSKVYAGKGNEKNCPPKESSNAKTANADDVVEECFPKPTRFKTDCYDVCAPKDGSPKRNASEHRSDSKSSSRERSPNVTRNVNPCTDPASSGMVCDSQAVKSEENCKHPDKPHSSLTSCKDGMNRMIVDAHNGTVDTLKCAMEDFVGKLYQSTHDAVNRLATESSKRMAKFRGCDDSPPKTGEIVISDKSKVTIVIDADKKDNKNQSEKNDESVIGQIMRKVESTASVVSDKVQNSSTHKSYSSSYTNNSSKFDKPTTKPVSNDRIEDEISLESTVENFIETVKTKFYSLFYEGGATGKTCTSHDEDEKIMEKIID